jgi:hypothetical protein
MHEVIEMAVFVAVFFGLLAFLLASRWTVRFSALLVLALCLVYYLFQLKVL